MYIIDEASCASREISDLVPVQMLHRGLSAFSEIISVLCFRIFS
jgi:hypothetical protein